MNCKNCGAKLSSISKFCPECGAKIDLPEAPKQNSDTSTIEAVMSDLVNQFGKDVYKKDNATKLKNLLCDLAAKFPRELKLLTRVVPEGLQEILLNADNGSEDEKQSAVTAFQKQLVENAFLSEQIAAEAANILAGGLGWKIKLTSDITQASMHTETQTINQISEQTVSQKAKAIAVTELQNIKDGHIVASDGSGEFTDLEQAMKFGTKQKLYLASGSYTYSFDKIKKSLTALPGINSKPTVVLSSDTKCENGINISNLCFIGEGVGITHYGGFQKRLTIDNCKFQGCSLYIYGTINNCEITNSHSDGIKAYCCFDYRRGDNPSKIKNCLIHDNRENGVLCECGGVDVENCEIYNNKKYGIKEEGFNCKIKNCNVHDNGLGNISN